MEQRFIKRCVIIQLTWFCSLQLIAQGSPDTTQSPKQIRYVLPDGKVLALEKWDSLERAWGKGRVALGHSEEDDSNGIVHLVHLPNDGQQGQSNQTHAVDKIFNGMLNKPAPDFELSDMEGKQWSLRKLRGKVVVLNFWFTSCAPCIQEMPELNKLTEAYSPNEVVFLALTFNDEKKVDTFLTRRKFDFVILPNSREVDQQYNVHSWPTSMVIDKVGNIKRIVQSNPKIQEEITAAIDSSIAVK